MIPDIFYNNYTVLKGIEAHVPHIPGHVVDVTHSGSGVYATG